MTQIKNSLPQRSFAGAFGLGLVCSALVNANIALAQSNLIKVDGSSTVYPITEAVAEEFSKSPEGAKVNVTVGISGTGGGFKKFCAGETDLSNASRPIKATEVELCQKNGVEFVELPVAYDALAVVVHPKNNWAKSLTVKELKMIWAPEAQGKINNWQQIRPEFPDKPLKLYGAGVDSGTYDYFTEAVVGKEHSSRGDFTSSEDDNTLVQGVSSDEGALGFFGLAYYVENKDKLLAVSVDDEIETNGAGPQLPSRDNVVKGVYKPLARPLFVYVRKAALEKAEIKNFVNFYVNNAPTLSEEVGYVGAPAEVYVLAKARLEKIKTGTLFTAGVSDVGVSLVDIMRKDG